MPAIARSLLEFVITMLLVCIVIVACYNAAPVLPVSFGAENGLVEWSETVVLLAGGLLCFFYRAQCRTARWRTFWLIIAPIWFIFAFRELSWGAVFLAPVSVSEILGPTYPSSSQLWYKAAVAPLIGMILLVSAWTFVRTKQVLSVKDIVRNQPKVLRDLFLCVLFMVCSAAAESHLGLSLQMGAGAAQVFEEMMELCAYSILLLAQYRVAQIRYSE